MILFGRRADGGRELMVYVVVDDKTAGERYGSRAAGPAAGAILREALGLSAGGETLTLVDDNGFVPSLQTSQAGCGVQALPWAQGAER
jgi:hypothetical protein